MLDSALLSEHWPAVLGRLPSDFDLDASARATGAFTRARGVPDPAALLRLCLAYAGGGLGLREVCSWAEAVGVAQLSNPALSNRLAKCEGFLRAVAGALLSARAETPTRCWAGHRLCLVDATALCAPGAERTSWRVHLAYDLGSARIERVDLTDGSGAESLTRFPPAAGDIQIGDGAYPRPAALRRLRAAGGHVIAPIGWNTLRLHDTAGEVIDLLTKLRASGETAEFDVEVADAKRRGVLLPMRLVARRHPPEKVVAAQTRRAKRGRKLGKKTDPRTLEAAGYLILLTSLPAETFPAEDVLALYRLRWQIELAFKRLKSILDLDDLPARTPTIARAWIWAKIILALLVEDAAGQLPDSPP